MGKPICRTLWKPAGTVWAVSLLLIFILLRCSVENSRFYIPPSDFLSRLSISERRSKLYERMSRDLDEHGAAFLQGGETSQSISLTDLFSLNKGIVTPISKPAYPPVRANVLYLSSNYADRLSQAVRDTFLPYFDGSIWFQNASFYHFSMFHASHHLSPVLASNREIEAEIEAVETMTKKLCPLKIVLDRVVLTSTGVVLGCWQVNETFILFHEFFFCRLLGLLLQVISGSDPLVIREELSRVLPRAPVKQFYDPVLLHSSFARILGRPKTLGEESLNTEYQLLLLHKLVREVDQKLRGFEARVWQLCYVEELDILALALNGRMKVHSFNMVGCPTSYP